MNIKMSKNNQAMPSVIQEVKSSDFETINDTKVCWLSGGAAMINSRGTTLLIDPVLRGFDMPLLFEPPLKAENVPHLDGYLVTHIDNDHFSKPTCHDLLDVTDSYHTTQYVAEVMNEDGIPGIGHDIGETFKVKDLEIEVTPAWHNWQNDMKKWQYREWKREDYCGFYISTPDGKIWMPGDSRLLDEQLHYPAPDVILLDFSDNDWHITFDGAVKLCNAYPDAILIPIHWGSVDAVDWSTFNGNPEDLEKAIVNPERLKVLGPGEFYHLG